MTWPDTLPPESLLLNEVRKQQEQNFKRARYQDYMYFLSNVKNIPIGIKPIKSFIANDNALYSPGSEGAEKSQLLAGKALNYGVIPKYGGPSHSPLDEVGFVGNCETSVQNWNFQTVGRLTNGISTTKFHVVLPVMSGVIGSYAEKMFPTMLIAPSTMYVALKFTQPEILFQCAMDPCRRVHGTFRDYVPNCGLSTMYATEFRGQVLGPSMQGCIRPCDGTNNTFMAITNAAAKGEDFAWQGIFAAPAGKPVGTDDAYTVAPVVDASRDNGYYIPANTTSTLAVAAYPATGVNQPGTTPATHTQIDPNQGYGVGNAYGTNLLNFARSDECLYGGMRGSNNGFTSALREDVGPNGNVIGIGEGYTTGLAKPQYVPRPTPWLFGGNGFSDDAIKAGYCKESEMCFGTYLPFSTAQVRRILPSTNPICSQGDANAASRPTYQIDGLQLVYQQVVLPDAVTSSIVQAAAHQTISLDAQSVSTYRTVCALSEFQSLLFPVKLASVNGVWVYFHNMRTQNLQEALYYNSFAGICPFSSFTWNPDNRAGEGPDITEYFVGSYLPPTVNSVLTTGSNFSYQFRIGSELFPLVLVNNIAACIKELVRSVHGPGDLRCRLPFYSWFRHARYGDNTRTNPANTRGQSEHTCLRSGQYTVPFVPVEAIEDQTITDNIAFPDYYASTDSSIKKAPWYYHLRGYYSLPDFLPPESSFVIGCDFDTFPGQGNQARSGRYIGTSPITLVMSDTKGLNNKSNTANQQQDAVVATLIALHDIRIDFTAGGNCLAFK